MEPNVTRILSQTNFAALDWVIVFSYLAISLVIGLTVRRYVKNMTDYIGAGRALGTWLGIATMSGTEMGLITIMYGAQKGFSGGFAAFHIALVAGVVTFFVGVSGFIVARLRALEVLTIPEFYQLRFDRRTRVLGGFMLALGGILNMGLFLRIGSMFIVGVTGLSSQGSTLQLVMVFLLTLVLIYTVLGGMLSVVITDYIQFIVLSCGLLLAVFLTVQHLGWDSIFQTLIQEMGPRGFDPFLNEGEFGIIYVLWMVFTAGLVSCAIWPTAVARALAAESPQVVRKQYMWSSISFMVRFLIPNFLGICAFVLVCSSPELKALFAPTDGSAPVDNLYAMPIMLARIIPSGLIGIISAAMIAAFMSTHDSYLLVWSSVITQDVIAPLRRKKMSARARIKTTRVAIVLIGIYVLFWGLVYQGRDDIWDYMAVTGAIYFTGAFALLVGGLYWKRASSTGAFLALISGSSALLGLDPIQRLLGFDLESARVGLASVAISSVTMVLGSLLFPDPPKKEVSHGVLA